MLPVWLVIGGFLIVLLAPSAGVLWWRSDATDRARVETPVAVQAPRPAPAAPAPAPIRDTEVSDEQQWLDTRPLVVPVSGIQRHQLRDTFHELRGSRRIHQALDIMAPWGTPVVAADDGRITRISSNRGGGLAIFQTDPSGRLVYYYAHLAGYADNLREGQDVKRGDLLGYVGATGNAPDHAPHLHFGVQAKRKGRWWGGEALNPYAALRQDGTLAARQ